MAADHPYQQEQKQQKQKQAETTSTATALLRTTRTKKKKKVFNSKQRAKKVLEKLSKNQVRLALAVNRSLSHLPSDVIRVESCEERRSGGSAQVLHVVLLQGHPFPRKAVQVGRADERVVVTDVVET